MDALHTWISGADGTRLFVRQWKPEGRPRGVVHIVHGMAEHSLRYGELAGRLCGGGFEVWAADMRGHGKTADPGVNGSGTGGLLGHCADRDGFSLVVSDIEELNRHIAETYPELPLFLLGHSWGSFITQAYIESYRRILGGCILSGTRGPDGLKVAISVPVMKTIAFFRGVRNRSLLARALADGAFNKSFRPNRTNFDWLSRDEKIVDAFAADPLCGKLCSVGFYRDLAGALSRIHKPKAMDGIPRDLPIYVFSGSADPVGDMGSSPTALVNAYRSMGVKDLEFVLYPDARHEPLNETNREEVMENLLAWLSRHCSPEMN
ncbi:MAG: lysophospholipase [Spirochaetaceae bacterium]|nr:lysophospholipase [Spirochaetaceae bacterium]